MSIWSHTLSSKEEAEYFKFKKDKIVREKIINCYSDLIKHIIAVEYSNRGCELEDLYSVGIIALIEIIDNREWDDTSLLWHHILDNVRENIEDYLLMNQRYTKEKMNIWSCNEFESDVETEYTENELFLGILKVKSKFSIRNQEIMEKHLGVYCDPVSIKELSKLYFISESQLRKIRCQFFKIMENELKRKELIDENVVLRRQKK